ncbi:MAG TPA: pectate lyase [Pirellulaceae bacterium]|nr:pectate lyase [Pirellulaceae bacterium]
MKSIIIISVLLLALCPALARIPGRYANQSAEWFKTDEGRRIADNVLTWQSPHGSWPKNGDTASRPYTGDKDKLEGTFDNSATTGELRFLASAFKATNEPRYQQAFLRGLDHIFEAQYANGGWPQFFPLSSRYHRHITFNDGTMINLMVLLQEIARGDSSCDFLDAERRKKAEAAIARGVDCILKTQIKQKNGQLSVWCAQYNEETLAPAWARAYEPPSLSGAESVGVVRFLMSVEKPTPEIVTAVEGSVAWFKQVAIHGYRFEEFNDANGMEDKRIVADAKAGLLWARFYELDSNRPMFLDRDSVVRYSLAEVGQERRGGYDWYGGWAERLLVTEYPEWRSKHRLSER